MKNRLLNEWIVLRDINEYTICLQPWHISIRILSGVPVVCPDAGPTPIKAHLPLVFVSDCECILSAKPELPSGEELEAGHIVKDSKLDLVTVM